MQFLRDVSLETCKRLRVFAEDAGVFVALCGKLPDFFYWRLGDLLGFCWGLIRNFCDRFRRELLLETCGNFLREVLLETCGRLREILLDTCRFCEGF